MNTTTGYIYSYPQHVSYCTIHHWWYEAECPLCKVEGLEEPIEQSQQLAIQVGGNHYKDFKIQPAEYVHANNLPWHEGEIIKYVTRHRKKGGVTDLKKAEHLIKMLIEMEEKGTKRD